MFIHGPQLNVGVEDGRFCSPPVDRVDFFLTPATPRRWRADALDEAP